MGVKDNAVNATQADLFRSDRDPRNTTHGEPNMKSSVVSTLTVARAEWYHESNSIPLQGQTPQAAPRNACHPGIAGRYSPGLITGRNQATKWSSHAAEIRRPDLFILLIPLTDPRFAITVVGLLVRCQEKGLDRLDR